jgi:hypothetical protein
MMVVIFPKWEIVSKHGKNMFNSQMDWQTGALLYTLQSRWRKYNVLLSGSSILLSICPIS